MKKDILRTLIPSILLFAAAGAIAYSGGDDNWNVDGLNGELRVHAALLASPCSLSAESTEQTVSLGDIPLWQLSGTEGLSESVPVHLILEDCLSGSTVRDREHGNTLTWLPDQQVVMMNVIGDEDPDDHRFYRLHGSSRGVAMRLEDDRHHLVIPGETSWPQVLKPGRNDLTLHASVSRTGDELAVGDFRAVVNIGLEYQ